MPGPIGISFLPSDQQAANGPMQGSLEGDLGQALKILSLQLPRRPSVRGIAPPRLMNASPMQAVIQALLHAGGLSAGGDAGYGAGGPAGYGSSTPRVGAGDTNGSSGVVADNPGGGSRAPVTQPVDRSGGMFGGDAGTYRPGPWGVSQPNPNMPVLDRSTDNGGGIMRRSPWNTY